MAKAKRSRIWTVCYIMWNPEREEAEPYTNSWFAYGRDKEEARANFLRHFEQERENFYGGDDPRYQMSISHIFEGFSC